jgi:predicted nuclease of predicted toxin-antitoxin system
MRVVLDECLPKRLTRELPGHEVCTVQQMGWIGISNGKLLALIHGQFDAFITVDSNLAYQQNLSTLPVAVVVLRAQSNKIEDIRPLLPGLLAALAILKPGDLRVLGGSLL